MHHTCSLFGQNLRVLAFFCGAVMVTGCGSPPPPLPSLNIDPGRVTVSGISSGAYMAHQVHLAHSTRIAGAGLIAGGPYSCALGQLDRALKLCMQTIDAGPDVPSLIERTEARAAAHEIDPLAGLDGDRIWIFHGDADTTVAAPVSAAIAKLYAGLSGRAEIEQSLRAGVAHTFPTLSHGGDCDQSQSPYLGRCGWDAAGEIFRHVVLATGEPAATATGRVLAFDQSAFADANRDAMLAGTGYVYVPTRCHQASCGLHIAFHGCQMSAQRIDKEFVEHAGYNRWADLAGIVVVYPQTRSSLMPLNPKGCWDWWGYTGSDYDTRSGAQIAWVGRLLDQLGVRER